MKKSGLTNRGSLYFIQQRSTFKLMEGRLRFSQVTVKFRNKPRGLYFSKALFEGLIFGGAYLRREICVSKSIGLTLLFWLCFTLYLRAISKYKPREGLYLEGPFNGGFLALRVSGLIHGGAYFRNFTVC